MCYLVARKLNGFFRNVLDAAAFPVALSETSAPREAVMERMGSASGSPPAPSGSTLSDSVTGRAGFPPSNPFRILQSVRVFLWTHKHTHTHKRFPGAFLSDKCERMQ